MHSSRVRTAAFFSELRRDGRWRAPGTLPPTLRDTMLARRSTDHTDAGSSVRAAIAGIADSRCCQATGMSDDEVLRRTRAVERYVLQPLDSASLPAFVTRCCAGAICSLLAANARGF
jgi:hypothetical protein